LVKIERQAEASFIDRKEVPQPGAEEDHHPRITIHEADSSIALGPFPRVQRDPGDQELPLRQAADPGPALLDQAVDLGLLAALEGVGGAAAAPGRAGEWGELHVADPQRDAAPGDAEGGRDLGQGQAGAAQPARLLLFGELAPVAHGRILP